MASRPIDMLTDLRSSKRFHTDGALRAVDSGRERSLRLAADAQHVGPTGGHRIASDIYHSTLCNCRATSQSRNAILSPAGLEEPIYATSEPVATPTLSSPLPTEEDRARLAEIATRLGRRS